MDKKQTYRRIAKYYDFLDSPFEYGRYRSLRRILFEGLGGQLLDAGVGTGRNFPYYPKDANVTGIDLSPAMLERAKWRQERLQTHVDLCEMNVLSLDFPDDHFDGIVSSFLFCVLGADHQQLALAELCRVCRPNGIIRILEYSISEDSMRRFVMRLWAPWAYFAYGAKFDRNTEQYVEEAGLDLVKKTFLYRDIIKLLEVRPRIC